MTTETQRHLMNKWEPVIAQSDFIFTWTGRGEMGYLAELASHSEFGIEQGCYMGASAFVQLAASPRLHLWIVDPFMVAGTEQVTRHNLRQFIKEGRCEVIPKYTPAAAEQLAHLKDRLDYVFIDGGHSKADVLQDIKCWRDLVRPGGLLVGHDYAMEQDGSGWNGVAQAVHESLPGFYSPVPNMWAWVR